MVVALRALEGGAQPDGACGNDTVEDLIDTSWFIPLGLIGE